MALGPISPDHGRRRNRVFVRNILAQEERDVAHMSTRLLTLREVTRTAALSRSAVYALMAESRFPKPLRIGSRAVRWVEQEVLDFIASRPRAGSDRPAA